MTASMAEAELFPARGEQADAGPVAREATSAGPMREFDGEKVPVSWSMAARRSR